MDHLFKFSKKDLKRYGVGTTNLHKHHSCVSVSSKTAANIKMKGLMRLANRYVVYPNSSLVNHHKFIGVRNISSTPVNFMKPHMNIGTIG